ncbi:MAG: hypothetical protein KDJ19_05530 [Hyphomicrobiaceae bacterium]|nr:hypothetical protein [Hyphomicrobiaceae bacterium]MCC0024204.1 hypothetical protein [Hyphomicrobiaceae bacterium]
MVELDQDQQAMKASIRNGALVLGGVGFVIVGLLAYWLLGSQGDLIRAGGGAVIGALAGFGLFRWNFTSRSKGAACAKCGSVYSISRTDRNEVFKSSENKMEREAQADGSTKVTSWVEEVYDVTETYTCSSCGDVTTKNFTTTRRKDEEERIEGPRGLGRVDGEAGQDSATGMDIEAAEPDAPPPPPTPRGGTTGRTRN